MSIQDNKERALGAGEQEVPQAKELEKTPEEELAELRAAVGAVAAENEELRALNYETLLHKPFR